MVAEELPELVDPTVPTSRSAPERVRRQASPIRQEFYIPIWTQVRLTPSEVRIVNHPAFARLGDIYQLGQTHLVFRGATHRRWEHALGTLHAAELMCAALERSHADAEAKHLPAIAGTWRRGPTLSDVELCFIRLSALLHDIGHIAAGHTFEDELGLLPPHDADERLSTVLDRANWRGEPEVTLRAVIDEEYADQAAASCTMKPASEIVLDVVSKDRVEVRASTPDFKTQVCRDIVGNTICADLLDYLHRDWHHLGKPRHFDNRLLDYLEIRNREQDPLDCRLVVNLRSGPDFRADAITAIFELLESRYQLGEVALFHRTKLTASAMLERLIAEVADASEQDGWFEAQVDKLLECTDEEMIQYVVGLGSQRLGRMKGARRTRLKEVLHLGRSLRYRQLHHKVVAYRTSDLSRQSLNLARRSLGGSGGAAGRLNTCRSLEEDFGLASGSVVIHCPAKAPHAKIARVQVLADDDIQELADLDSTSGDPAGTGGLMQSQLQRFEGLWRVQVSISSAALNQMTDAHTLTVFKRTVRELVLKSSADDSSLDQVAYELASSLIGNPAFPTTGKELVEVGQAQGRAAEWKTYATGAPTLSSLILSSKH